MKTVLTHGVFDVLHAGHLAYFEEAKKYGDRLIVSITSDRFINKGPGRPYFSQEKRASMVKALSIVDQVEIIDAPTALPAIQKIKPDYYVKGPDYRDLSKDVTGEILNEKKAVEAYGGKLIFTDTETFSSSTLINKFFQNWTDGQKAQIESIKSFGGIEAIEGAINRLNELCICVIGEPILDVYRFVTPEGISSKSPSISARFDHEETYHGGSTAIYRHLQDFCDVKFIPPLTKSRVYPSKIRYIDQAKSQRIFEVTEIREDDWLQDEYISRLPKDSDCYVIADFGHGLFEGQMLEAIDELRGFIGLNVQTNSSNFGYNVYTKHRRFDYLCLDTREARLAMHDRFSDPMSIARRIREEINRPFGFTCGANGAHLLGEQEHFSPAFSDVVIDATGAGDAYFAITTVLLASGCNPALVPFIGNVFAGLKTKILGNKSAVSKVSLLKACQGILK